MKKWNNPEIEVFSVKLDENIAASGSEGSGYLTGYLNYDLGGITRGGANYNYNALNQVQDTGIVFYKFSTGNAISKNDVDTVAGCLA